MNLSVLYRGPLSSCNYNCHYCPFAKHRETAAELADDRRNLLKFSDWVCNRPEDDRIGVFFTPWGEALTRRWYRDSIARLSHCRQVTKVAVQTNLSCQLDWLKECRQDNVGLWCTYHPSETSLSAFLAQCRELDGTSVSYSVGVVGLKENFSDIESLRAQLSPGVYLWINAYKDVVDYYSPDETERLETIDPLFRINNTRHSSFGKACRTGETVVSVDGDGDVRRCHFIKDVIGNIYQDDIQTVLAPRSCTNRTCGCHIGYVHMGDLHLEQVFGEGILERVPSKSIWRDELAEGCRRWAAERSTSTPNTLAEASDQFAPHFGADARSAHVQ